MAQLQQQSEFNRRRDKSEEAAKPNGNIDHQPPKIHPFRQALPQILATTAKNILLLGYGMTLGFPTIVIPNLKPAAPFNNSTMNGNMTHNVMEIVRYNDPYQLYLTRDQISWFSSINHICVPLGCMLSGVLTQPFGRKPSMIGINIPFIFAWLIFHYSNSVWMLYTAVALTGFSGGLLEAPVLTYVAEITTPQLRGMLSATASMVVILGVFVQFILGYFIFWRTIALVNVMFPVIAICCLCAVPESPHWLIGKGRIEEAEKSLQWLRGWVQPSAVQVELSHLVKSIQSSCTPQDKKEKPSWKSFTKRTFIRPYLVVSMTFLIGHFCGMTTLQTYAVYIFNELGTPIDKYFATLILGLVQLLGALVCVVLVHWTGKRPLALISITGCGICFVVVALCVKFEQSHQVHSWVPVSFLVFSAFMTHMCIRLLPWILVGEVYPPEVRATASGASGSIGYIFGFIANKSFFKIIDTIELSGSFYCNAAISFLGAAYIYYQLPETEGKTLLEIQEHFAGEKLLENRSGKTKENWAVDNPALEHGESNL